MCVPMLPMTASMVPNHSLPLYEQADKLCDNMDCCCSNRAFIDTYDDELQHLRLRETEQPSDHHAAMMTLL